MLYNFLFVQESLLPCSADYRIHCEEYINASNAISMKVEDLQASGRGPRIKCSKNKANAR